MGYSSCIGKQEKKPKKTKWVNFKDSLKYACIIIKLK